MNDLVNKAREYAFKKHDQPSESQRYGSAPYSKHLEDVANVFNKYKYLIFDDCHEDVLAAIFLHDSVEDTDTTPDVLKRLFNERVAEIVYRVSNERGLSKKEINFKTYPKIWQHDLATFVKLCDRIANGINSKNGDSDKSKRMYKRYTEEYPIFRYALKKDNLYNEMWVELDLLFNYKISF